MNKFSDSDPLVQRFFLIQMWTNNNESIDILSFPIFIPHVTSCCGHLNILLWRYEGFFLGNFMKWNKLIIKILCLISVCHLFYMYVLYILSSSWYSQFKLVIVEGCMVTFSCFSVIYWITEREGCISSLIGDHSYSTSSYFYILEHLYI